MGRCGGHWEGTEDGEDASSTPPMALGIDLLINSSILQTFLKITSVPRGHRLNTPLLTVKSQGETSNKQPNYKQLVIPMEMGAPLGGIP